jgi:hypothetical protein
VKRAIVVGVACIMGGPHGAALAFASVEALARRVRGLL